MNISDKIKHRSVVFGYLLLGIGVSLGLFYQQKDTKNKFCDVTIQQRELIRSAIIDRQKQSKIFADETFSLEVRKYHNDLYQKYVLRLKEDPDLQLPITCEVHK